MAKLNGSYHHIDGGHPPEAINMFNGGPHVEFAHDNKFNQTEGKEDLEGATFSA